MKREWKENTKEKKSFEYELVKRYDNNNRVGSHPQC